MKWLPVAVLLTLAVGCSGSPDIDAWRLETRSARPAAQRGSIEVDLARVDELRSSQAIGPARELAIALAVENPEAAGVLWRAARAESDGVFLFRGDDEKKALAALSALDYAERAVAVEPRQPSVLGEWAWALGASTHLQPMFDRSDHATKTLAVIDEALELDSDQAAALATKATLRLRLATLPWIAKVMASGAPEGDLDEALALADRCVELSPNLEHQLLRAKVLVAMERIDDAIGALTDGLGNLIGPRDGVLRSTAVELRDDLRDAE